MTTIDKALAMGQEKNRTLLTAVTETSLQIREGKRCFIKHLTKGLSGVASYREAFTREYETCRRLDHPHLLPYEASGTEDDGEPYIRMAGISCQPLGTFLGDNPAFVSQTKEMNRLIGELTDAVAYLHRQGICHLDLRPANLLVTHAQKNLLLVNPFSPYLPCRPAVVLGDAEFTAPELLSGEGTGDERSDIYAIGRLIAYLFRYTRLPYAYRKIIGRATQPDPSARYTSVEEMRETIRQAVRVERVCRRLLCGAAVVAVAVCVWAGVFSGEEEIEFVTPVQVTRTDAPPVTGNEGVLLPDTALLGGYELTPEQTEEMRKYQEKAEQIFRKDFARKAETELSKIYTPRSMEGDLADFRVLSLQGMTALDDYQKELCEKYQMDPVVGAKLAAEVISRITQEKMKALKEAGAEEE